MQNVCDDGHLSGSRQGCHCCPSLQAGTRGSGCGTARGAGSPPSVPRRSPAGPRWTRTWSAWGACWGWKPMCSRVLMGWARGQQSHNPAAAAHWRLAMPPALAPTAAPCSSVLGSPSLAPSAFEHLNSSAAAGPWQSTGPPGPRAGGEQQSGVSCS